LGDSFLRAKRVNFCEKRTKITIIQRGGGKVVHHQRKKGRFREKKNVQTAYLQGEKEGSPTIEEKKGLIEKGE